MAFIPSRQYTPDEYRQKPKEFNPLLAEKMIVRIANGETLHEICDERDMPLPATFLSWIEMDEELARGYAKAQRYRTTLLVERMVGLGDAPDPSRARLAFDVNRFHAERLMPDQFGPANFRQNQSDQRTVRPDHRAELRRRIDDIVSRRAASCG